MKPTAWRTRHWPAMRPGISRWRTTGAAAMATRVRCWRNSVVPPAKTPRRRVPVSRSCQWYSRGTVLSKGRRSRRAGPGALVLILAAGVCAAQQPESNPFYNELKQPWQLYRAGKLDDAAAGFRAVLEKATTAQDRLAQAWAHEALGTIFDDKAEYPAARSAFEQSLLFYQSIQDSAGEATANEHLGDIWVLMGDDVLAREYYRKALKTFELLGMLDRQAKVMGRLTHANDPEGEKLNQRALEIGRQLGDKGLQAHILHSIGDGFFMKGVFDAAQEHYHQAAALYGQAGEPLGLARVLTSEGRLQRAHGHSEKSLELYAQAFKLQQENHDRQGAIQSINAMAVAWQQLGDFAKSAEHYQQALSMARETGSEKIVNFELANMAGVYTNLGRDREAAEILENLLHQNPAMDWAYLR